MKDLNKLINENDSAWSNISGWISEARNTVEILPATESQAEKVISELQLTTRSSLGAVAYQTGGMLFANGWLRFLGSGHKMLSRSLVTWNQNDKAEQKLGGGLLVADDVLGGFFALNGGLFEGEIGDVFYFAPDILEWERTEIGYSDLLYWACSGDLQQFYKTFRWDGWEQEVQKVCGNEGILIYPPLWAKGEEIRKRARSIVPIEELWHLNMMYREKFSE
jgi:hypothetical protein